MSEEQTQQVNRVAAYRSRRHEPRDVTLPSGDVFTIVTLTPLDFIEAGIKDIPNDFFRYIAELELGVMNSTSQEEAKANSDLLEKYWSIMLDKGTVNPPVCLKYDADKASTHLIYAEMSEDDQVALIKAILGRA